MENIIELDAKARIFSSQPSSEFPMLLFTDFGAAFPHFVKLFWIYDRYNLMSGSPQI